MNINTLFITCQYVKQFSTVGDNTDDAYITPAIMDAQLIDLQGVIGTNLYDKIAELIDNETIGSTGKEPYKQLLDNYIAPYLLHKCQSYLLINLMAKERNAGVVTYYDNNQTQMQLSEVKFIKSEFDNKASFYGRRMMDWLHANASKFPEFCVCRDCSDMHHDARNTFASNLNLHLNKHKKHF